MKNKVFMMVLSISVILTSGCFLDASHAKQQLQEHSPYAPQGFQLVFSDDFDGDALDTDRWDYRLGGRTDPPWDSIQLVDNVSVEDGHLIIRGVNDDPRAAGNNTGGGIITKEKFKYGYYEARVKTHEAEAYHSAFWLFNHHTSQHVTEIDIFEIDSEYDIGSTHVVSQNVHFHSGSGKLGESAMVPVTFDPSEDYHIYGRV